MSSPSEQDKKIEEAQDSPLPSVAALKKSVKISSGTKAKEDLSSQFTDRAIISERGYIHLVGLRSHYTHKAWWSYFISSIMLLMIAFQSVLLGMVGAGIWSFEKYTWLLPALLVQNLAQVIGLAIVVVKSLFKEMNLN